MSGKQAERICLRILADRCATAQVDDLVSCGYVAEGEDATKVYAALRRWEDRFRDGIARLANDEQRA